MIRLERIIVIAPATAKNSARSQYLSVLKSLKRNTSDPTKSNKEIIPHTKSVICSVDGVASIP